MYDEPKKPEYETTSPRVGTATGLSDKSLTDAQLDELSSQINELCEITIVFIDRVSIVRRASPKPDEMVETSISEEEHTSELVARLRHLTSQVVNIRHMVSGAVSELEV